MKRDQRIATFQGQKAWSGYSCFHFPFLIFHFSFLIDSLLVRVRSCGFVDRFLAERTDDPRNHTKHHEKGDQKMTKWNLSNEKWKMKMTALL
jgi:hypothetical protein